MKRLMLALLLMGLLLTQSGCGNQAAASDRRMLKTWLEAALAETPIVSEARRVDKNTILLVRMQGDKHTIVFELNHTPAAQSFYNQLPLTVEVEDFGTNEKIFYPPEALDTTDSVSAEGPAGTLAYFSPWGDVVMYYERFSAYNGLYELGHAVSGSEWIAGLSGTLEIKQEKE